MPSKFGERISRRGVLGSKQGNKGYYKGSGGRNEGSHTNKGAYVIKPLRLMEIIVPPKCDLKPYVAAGVHAPTPGKRVPDYAALAGKQDELK